VDITSESKQGIHERTGDNIYELLKQIQDATGADDVRFRVRDWKDESIVYVPGWIFGSELDKSEPTLSQRYYKKNIGGSLIFDCYVGLAALIGRLKEEEAKEKERRNEELIKKLEDTLKKYSYRADQEYIFIEDLQKELGKRGIYDQFVNKLERKKDEWKSKQDEWQAIKDKLEDRNIDSREALESFVKENIKKNARCKRCLEIIKHLYSCEDDYDRRKTIEKFLNLKSNKIKNFQIEAFSKLVHKTIERYSGLYEEWDKYIKFTRELRSEIAIPVFGFGQKFIGVLNLHKRRKHRKKRGSGKSKFIKDDVLKSQECASKLAQKCIQRQMEQLEEFQDVSRQIAAGNTFAVIISSISNCIRDVLKDGLARGEVYPMIHILREPVGTSKSLTKLYSEWEKSWGNSYYPGEEPAAGTDSRQLWEEEKVLGRTPIRPGGLGKRVIENWRNSRGPLFVDEKYVDNLDAGGSIAAYFNRSKTTGCLPLIFGGQLLGLLYIHCKKRHFFTESEVSALNALANQSAIALNNVKLLGDSYEEQYGDKLIEELLRIKSSHDSPLKEVHEILKAWVKKVRQARGIGIVDVTVDTIAEICQYFRLPARLLEYFIEDYKKREGALQFIENHREHFIHPFHVFLLGYIILAKWKADKTHKGKLLMQFLENDDEIINLKTWFIACIYHDVGYPAEKLPLLATDIFEHAISRKVSGQFDWSPIIVANDNDKHIVNFSQRYGEHFNDNKRGEAEKFRKWFYHRLLEEHDHGTLAALILLNKWGTPKAKERIFLYEACLAICLHSLKYRKENVNNEERFEIGPLKIGQFPLAFFLQYCDYAQEWGRRVYHERMRLAEVRLDFQETEKQFDTRLMHIGCEDKVAVEIKYINTLRGEEVLKNQNLEQLFKDLDAHFKNFWQLEKTPPSNFIIAAGDKNDDDVGSFSPLLQA
jgi:hypothetical protein